MIRPPPISPRTDTRFPYTTRFRAAEGWVYQAAVLGACLTDRDLARQSSRRARIHRGGDRADGADAAVAGVVDQHGLGSRCCRPAGLVFADDVVWRRRPVRVVLHARTDDRRSEEHTSELQSLMRISYAVFCLKKKNKNDRSDKTISNPCIS